MRIGAIPLRMECVIYFKACAFLATVFFFFFFLLDRAFFFIKTLWEEERMHYVRGVEGRMTLLLSSRDYRGTTLIYYLHSKI